MKKLYSDLLNAFNENLKKHTKETDALFKKMAEIPDPLTLKLVVGLSPLPFGINFAKDLKKQHESGLIKLSEEEKEVIDDFLDKNM